MNWKTIFASLRRLSLWAVMTCVCGVAPALAGTIITPVDPTQPVGAAAFVGIFENPGQEHYFTVTASDPSGISSLTQLLFGSVNNDLSSASASASTPFNGATGSGTATADLASGTLKVFATSSGLFTSVNHFNGLPYIGALATISQAAFEDTLTPTASGVLSFDIKVNGTIIQTDPTFSSPFAGINFAINGQRTFGTLGEFEFIGNNGLCVSAGDAISCDLSALTGVDVLDVPVTAGVPLSFTLALEADATQGTADFSHTLQLGVSGVSFTSNSGVFLTNVTPPTVPAPEPGSLLLLGTGLLSLVGAARRKWLG